MKTNKCREEEEEKKKQRKNEEDTTRGKKRPDVFAYQRPNQEWSVPGQ